MSQIQPVLSHAFTEPWMTKQSINRVLISIWSVVCIKGIDCFRGGGKTMQIVGKSADEGRRSASDDTFRPFFLSFSSMKESRLRDLKSWVTCKWLLSPVGETTLVCRTNKQER